MPIEMTYQQLGPSGLTVSTVGLGCNNFGARMADEDVPAVVSAAIDAGITLFDTADVYGNVGGSEILLGEALGSRRGEVIIATKFGSDMRGANGPDWGARGSRRYIRIAVENSLRRLGTDWIDLYQLHEPDPNTPIEETLAALSEIVAEGKVRYIGSSNLAGWEVIDADWTSRTSGFEAFISAQNEYSWLSRSVETELVPALEHTGQSLLPYFPLASGLLTGKYHRGQPAPAGSRLARNSARLDKADFDLIEAIEAYAGERGLSMLQVATGGLAAMPTVGSVIAGATSEAQVKENVAAGLWVPSGDDLEALLEITKSAV
jgi:aryl-alcohol dehydrogenase-like predicted oxidoreductase